MKRPLQFDVDSVREAMEILAIRLALPVIVMLQHGACGHAELMRRLDVESKQLTRVLRRLQKHDLIERFVKVEASPVRVSYSLTSRGECWLSAVAEFAVRIELGIGGEA